MTPSSRLMAYATISGRGHGDLQEGGRVRRGATPLPGPRSARQISGIYLENFFPRHMLVLQPGGMRSSTMADKGLSITPCNNAAIRQAARMLGQLYDDALAPSGLR